MAITIHGHTQLPIGFRLAWPEERGVRIWPMSYTPRSDGTMQVYVVNQWRSLSASSRAWGFVFVNNVSVETVDAAPPFTHALLRHTKAYPLRRGETIEVIVVEGNNGAADVNKREIEMTFNNDDPV